MRASMILILTAALLMPAAAIAQDEPPPPDPAELAQTLGIVDTDEAVLLIVAEGALDSLTVGGRDVVVAPPVEGEGVWRLVREQREGIVPVTITRGDVVWQGQVRTFAGTVTVVDAEVELSGPDARTGPAVDDEFDLFGFYDDLDAQRKDEDKLAYCTEVLTRTLSEADRTVVSETCTRLQASLDAEAASTADDDSEDLADALLDDDPEYVDDAPDPNLGMLYRRDGRPRLVARGTPERLILAGVGAVGTGIATYSALFWEFRAEQEYAAYRTAERVGDDEAMTRHLFFTRDYDVRRDASIGVATVCLTGTAVALAFQAIEQRRFRKQRTALEASAP
ncbi:MAG: hypothetical protein GY898_20955 [Proteobacteria bacterium]|nr:hypothetical protein [Pseudomonadota bacterium]